MHDIYLEHYGIPGMKWGRRKASSTSTNSSSTNWANVRRNTINIGQTKEGLNVGKKLVETKAKKLESDRVKKQTKKLTDEAKSMSESDLKRISDRIALEQRYVNLMKQTDVREAKSNLEKTLDAIGMVTTTATTALAVYEAIQKFK